VVESDDEWESISGDGETSRMAVPNGWLVMNGAAMAFVPNPTRDTWNVAHVDEREPIERIDLYGCGELPEGDPGGVWFDYEGRIYVCTNALLGVYLRVVPVGSHYFRRQALGMFSIHDSGPRLQAEDVRLHRPTSSLGTRLGIQGWSEDGNLQYVTYTDGVVEMVDVRDDLAYGVLARATGDGSLPANGSAWACSCEADLNRVGDHPLIVDDAGDFVVPDDAELLDRWEADA
jgi:hypothetical protein